VKILKTVDANFLREFENILNRSISEDAKIAGTVSSIIEEVKKRGDEALFYYNRKYDRTESSPETIGVGKEEIEKAYNSVKNEELSALKLAAERIERFHRCQLIEDWFKIDDEGILLGQIVKPLERVGIYVPGGKAAYPSSLLMGAIPAKVAGVSEIIVVSPTPDGETNPYLLAAARIVGVNGFFRVGGAQAIAALAYGTETIPKVDKIVGPGNIYVNTAKRLVFGEVGMDMTAGPSEILIISDGSGNPSYIAADLLSQAEHDDMAMSILLTPQESFAKEVKKEISLQMEGLSRKNIIRSSIENRGAIVITKNLQETVDLANRFAPEHLELAIENPFELLGQVKHAGAIFLGHFSPVAAGDYLAGPNHILPTGGTARFFSPLSISDFVKKSNFILFSKKNLSGLEKEIRKLAMMEELDAHAKAVEKRIKK
jgi:histidinol dehydrogenase